MNPLYVFLVETASATWFWVCSKVSKLSFNGTSSGAFLIHFFKYLSIEFNMFIILSNGSFTTDTAKLIESIVDLVLIILGVIWSWRSFNIPKVIKAVLAGLGEPGGVDGISGIVIWATFLAVSNVFRALSNGVITLFKLFIVLVNESTVVTILFNLIFFSQHL